MSRKNKNEDYFTSYAYGKENTPFPETLSDKLSPPETELDLEDSKDLFVEREETLEEQGQKYMDSYRKVERAIVCNFYTGGGKYSRGILDSIYKGFNPLNPDM